MSYTTKQKLQIAALWICLVIPTQTESDQTTATAVLLVVLCVVGLLIAVIVLMFTGSYSGSSIDIDASSGNVAVLPDYSMDSTDITGRPGNTTECSKIPITTVIVELCESSVERQVTFSDAEATPNSEPNPQLSHECADIAGPSASMAMEHSE